MRQEAPYGRRLRPRENVTQATKDELFKFIDVHMRQTLLPSYMRYRTITNTGNGGIDQYIHLLIEHIRTLDIIEIFYVYHQAKLEEEESRRS